MIPYEIRQAIVALEAQGRTLRDISRLVRVSRNTVRRALRQPHARVRRDSPQHEALVELLPDLYRRCRGNAVRIQEIVKACPERSRRAEQGIEIPYSTLTRLIRRQALREPQRRMGVYVFEPGAEMQHDTSPHRVSVGDKTLTAQCASLVLAYSRYLFIQYYPAFTRFEAMSFLTEAFRFLDGVCPHCTIDNTSVIVAGGSGPEALIAPQMVAFGELFGTRFISHAIGHADRKGRVERPFAYIQGNFLAGRRFRDWADLNVQARLWYEQVANAKPKRALGMSPKAAYTMEKPHLLPLPPHIPPVTQIHYRVVDTQGYVHLDTNRYSVPERWLGEKVAVHKQPEQVVIFARHALIAERFYKAQDLFDELYASLADRSTSRLLNRLSRYDVLLIDELGYLTLKPEQVNAFFKLLDLRYSQRPSIITTNLDYPEWYDLFQRKPLVDALLDRLQHHCITIRIDGPSLRVPDLDPASSQRSRKKTHLKKNHEPSLSSTD